MPLRRQSTHKESRKAAPDEGRTRITWADHIVHIASWPVAVEGAGDDMLGTVEYLVETGLYVVCVYAGQYGT